MWSTVVSMLTSASRAGLFTAASQHCQLILNPNIKHFCYIIPMKTDLRPTVILFDYLHDHLYIDERANTFIQDEEAVHSQNNNNLFMFLHLENRMDQYV